MADVVVENHGSIFMVTPLSAGANEWFDENVQVEAWAMMGASIAVDHHCIENLVQGLIDEGFTVK